jgi:hypothetical protein
VGRAKSIVVVAVVVASACYTLFPPGTPVDFCVQQASLYCDLQFKCCTAVERERSPLGANLSASIRRKAPSSAGECTEVVAEICRAAVEQQNESVREERVTFDADEAVDCLEDLQSAVDDCDPGDFFDAQGTYLIQMFQDGQPGLLGNACDNAIEGDVDEDDTCFADYECKKGECVVDPEADQVSLEGECQGDGEPGAPFDGNVKFEVCDGLDDEE